MARINWWRYYSDIPFSVLENRKVERLDKSEILVIGVKEIVWTHEL